MLGRYTTPPNVAGWYHAPKKGVKHRPRIVPVRHIGTIGALLDHKIVTPRPLLSLMLIEGVKRRAPPRLRPLSPSGAYAADSATSPSRARSTSSAVVPLASASKFRISRCRSAGNATAR